MRLVLGLLVGLAAVSYVAVGQAHAEDRCLAEDLFTASGIPMGEMTEALGCRQLTDGTWVMATIGDTRAYQHQVPIASGMQPTLDSGRAVLQALIREMANDPRLTRLFVYDMDHQTVVYPGARGTTNTVHLNGRPIGATPNAMFGAIYPQYEQAAYSFLIQPSHELLAGYVQWIMRARDSAALATTASLSLIQQSPVRDSFGYQTIPWPWRLNDPFTMDSFTLWAAATAGYSPPAPTPTPPSVAALIPTPAPYIPEPTLEANGNHSPESASLTVRVLDTKGEPMFGACILIHNAQTRLMACDNSGIDLDPRKGIVGVNLEPGRYRVESATGRSSQSELVVVGGPPQGTTIVYDK